MLLGLGMLNGFISASVFIDTYSRNKKSKDKLTKIGYKIKKKKDLSILKRIKMFIDNYLICFIPGLNIIKYISNISKSAGEYTNSRLKYYKKNKLATFGRYDSCFNRINKIEQKQLINNTSDMTLDEERSYFKSMSDRLHKDYDKLVKMKKERDAEKLKEVIEVVDTIYHIIIDEIDLGDFKFEKNNNMSRILKRR